MNDKLKRLAKKVVGLLPSDRELSINECHDIFSPIYTNQYDYFGYYSASDIVKLIIYLYSLHSTGNFEVGDRMLNDLSFATLIIPTGNASIITCHDCGGEGTSKCYSCGGNGEETCNYCGGDGCEECNQDGEVTCEECLGDGMSVCRTCDGDGEYKSTNKEVVEYYFIASWKKEINDILELRAGTEEPVSSEFEFDALMDEFLLLSYNELNLAITPLNDYETYCTSFGDEPVIKFVAKSYIGIIQTDDNLKNYTL
jgi:hypothetical protein